MTTITQTLAQRAIDLAREHRNAGIAPFGDLADEGSALLMDALGETGWTTEENQFDRWAAVNAYENVLAGPAPLTPDDEAQYRAEQADYTTEA
jgi:hypothetical protein